MSATRKGRSGRFAEFEEKIVKDFDIENEAPDEDEQSGSEESADENAGTEHYVAVGKSKLRQKDAIALGPEYRGSRVSREALEESSEDDEEGDEDEESGSADEEFDNPETADLEADHIDDDAEISSDNALCESDEENLKDFVFRGSSKPKTPNGRIKKRPTAADFMSSSGDEDDEEEDLEGEEDELEASEEGSELDEDGARLFDLEAELSGEDDDEDEEEDEDDEDEDEDEDEEGDEDDEDDEDDEEEEGDENDDEDEDEEDAGSDSGERAQLRKMATEGQKSIVAAMSQAARADAEKGVAVRAQRRAFDSILNLRIRLQKALVAANSFSVVENNHENGTEAYHAAEEAAVKLWNTIDSVRHTFMPESSRAKVGDKRKRGIDVDTPNQAIWESMQMVEEATHSHRRKVLDKWSERVKKSNAALSTRKLVKSESQTLVSALDEQLLSSERLVKRARMPRSCAPAQAAKKVEEDAQIYDDADFYQLLLKELVDQRSTDTGAPGESVATVRWAALKETKTRKNVDRRASKGRKLRYTVHEKLQNFMAPEDRREWEEHAIDRLFGTLFGQKMELKEEDEVSDEEMGGVNVEEEGLRLFRS
ncbi:apoptosis antagonizing transcription factor-domain-containing protein [Chaetomium tenue]|uniref:Apoptosis antagonizing transcription factor-domain-containing protein n=1 Tax=Chaetomium tenue TaxID=1854479 RepID=A0ACB7NWG3_9PEZI|nr:apoptosis antagonizing transcription factor-domain-containing protein [Chaetomium globosum]